LEDRLFSAVKQQKSLGEVTNNTDEVQFVHDEMHLVPDFPAQKRRPDRSERPSNQ
jgi:hypothetical protein